MEMNPLIGPVVALVAWTIVMLLWFAVYLFSAMAKGGIKPPPGVRVRDSKDLPTSIQWKNHNYMHLMEQPTIFYAIVFALILMGDSQSLNVTLAWGYVAFRVIHSLVQATFNAVMVRLALFLLSTACLAALTVHAALEAWHHLG